MANEPAGLRERKRRQTRQRIMDAALYLFAANGYDETTLEALAEAAEISQRSFFHYFASKEEVLASWQAGMPDQLYAAIIAQPEAKSPLEMLRDALLQIPAAFDEAQALAINRIIRTNEQLRAGNSAKMMRLEQVAYEALIQKLGESHDRDSLRMIAMVSVGATRIALDEWCDREDGTAVTDHISKAFGLLTAGLHGGRLSCASLGEAPSTQRI